MATTPKPTSIVFSSKKEVETVKRAAKRQGMSVTQFLRQVAVEKAQEALGHEPCPHCDGTGRVAAA